MTRPLFSVLVSLSLTVSACRAAPFDAASIDAALKADAYQGMIRLLDEADRQWAQVKTYRATFEKEERRQGKRQPIELIDYKYMRDHCVRMEWKDKENEGKRVLYVDQKYGNQLNIQTKVFFATVRLQKAPTDSAVMENSNHPITESGFGNSLMNIRRLTTELRAKGMVDVKYHGQVSGPDGKPCFKIERNFKGGTHLKKSVVLFDAATLMPVEVLADDASGFLERYTYKGHTLNPKLGNRDQLTVQDFYRSAAFPDDRDWGKEKETWTFRDIAPKYFAAGGKE